jgi:hypothetical protein
MYKMRKFIQGVLKMTTKPFHVRVKVSGNQSVKINMESKMNLCLWWPKILKNLRLLLNVYEEIALKNYLKKTPNKSIVLLYNLIPVWECS